MQQQEEKEEVREDGDARLQIQHISVLWAGVEQSLFGRKIAMMMMMVVVVVVVVVVVFRLAIDGAGAVDGGELAVVGGVSVATEGATVAGGTVATLAATSSAEDTAGETASVLELAATTVSGMFSVAFRTDGHTAPHGPVAPEAGHDQRCGPEQAPPRCPFVR